jgi:hypothetical protein
MTTDLSSNVIVTLEALLSSVNTFSAIETGNKNTLETLNTATFMQNLHAWAATGFIDSYSVYQFTLVAPQLTGNKYSCSDGTPRALFDYIPFFLGYSLPTFMATLQTKVAGITLSYSVSEDPIILQIHASR